MRISECSLNPIRFKDGLHSMTCRMDCRIRKNLKGKREIETVGLPFRAAISECSRGNNRQGLPKGAFNFLRQINDEEVARGIEVVFAGLINDAKVVLLLGFLVREDRVNLANDQVFAVLISEANGKPSWT